jgi:carboxymethylenebutenolidase
VGQKITIDMNGAGTAAAYLASPESGRGPGVMVLPEIAGVNFHLRAVVDYFAALGYVALAPNMFWRLDPVAEQDYSKEGSLKSIAFHERYNDDEGVEDLAIVANYIRSRPECTGKLGSVGYCFGGRMGYLAGVHNGLDAVASLYPTFIERCLDLAPRVTFPWSCHLPEHDPLETPEAQTKILAAFKNHKNVEIHRYPGAHHAFDSDAARKVYDRFASQLANSRVALFFDKHLGR